MNTIFKKNIFIFIYFFTLTNLSCQSENKVNTDSFVNLLKSIGFIEFNLSETKLSLLKRNKIIKKVYDDFEYYYLIKNEKILTIEKKVTYVFVFDKDELISCSFEMKDKPFFFKVLRDYIIESKQSTFINLKSKSRYRFFEENIKYEKYFKTKYKGTDFYITAGVDIKKQ